MISDKTWKRLGVCLIAGLFFSAFSKPSSHSSNRGLFEAAASAAPSRSVDGVGIAGKNAEIIFTCSQDGKTLYRWQYFGGKPPKYLGKSDAIESDRSRRE